jgi:pyruvate dehydrogenase E2 component (dihydrolipoamide acetyltransferase)
MATLLQMPEIATGDDSATLTSWAVGVGAPFRAADTIATIETAKAAVEVEAEADGVILAVLVEAGTDVSVGEPLALVGTPGETVGDLRTVLAELGVSDGIAGTPPPAADEPAEIAAPAPTPLSSGSEGADHAGWVRIFASPLARKLAREAGLSLDDLVGTGPDGRIRRDDVRAALAGRPAAAPVAPVAAPAPAPIPVTGNGFTDVPHTRLRRAIARRLTESVTTAPHFQIAGVAQVDRLLELRAEINASTPVKVSVNDLIVKAVARAHVAVPAMNVIWLPDAVRRFDPVDVGVAVSTPTGLVVPVLRGVDRLSIGEIATATKDLAVRAREGKLAQAELEGGTVSVSNLGMFGTRSFSAIINPPHAAILAVGAASPEPVAVDGRVEVRSLLHLTVSVDHRPVDGAIAAEWMRALVDVLEHPLGLLV